MKVSEVCSKSNIKPIKIRRFLISYLSLLNMKLRGFNATPLITYIYIYIETLTFGWTHLISPL